MENTDMSPALKYFFKSLEKKTSELDKIKRLEDGRLKEIPFDELEKFFRTLKTQNIFIHTVGINGKSMSMLLEKAIFNLNKVIRVYYSTSFDEFIQGFVRVEIDQAQGLILVERMHGYRPKPELMYASHDENRVIRFMVRWLLRRIDWDKTKLNNLELYKHYVDLQNQELEVKLAEEQALLEEAEIQEALDKSFGRNSKTR